ncbi:MAG: type II toxin-antitoxin system VapC family toxin [Acidobacteria bacterium]|nr:type II toxin-antitoxin system VapC family toxin [Acidobacteriota bacterium]
MSFFLDTSVLVPVFVADHPHHAVSIALFAYCTPENASCAAHSLAEVYSTLTRMPPPHRASPAQALKCVETIAERLRLVSLDGFSTRTAIQRAASQGVSGGTSYDSLIATCALQSGAQRIYTWNSRHFEQFGQDVAARLALPTNLPSP